MFCLIFLEGAATFRTDSGMRPLFYKKGITGVKDQTKNIVQWSHRKSFFQRLSCLARTRCLVPLRAHINNFDHGENSFVSKNKNHPIPEIRDTLPNHVAFVCDGNGRWAQQRNFPLLTGHGKGADRAVSTIKTLQSMGVKYCTFFVFSTENWSRHEQEVQDIMRIVKDAANKFRTVAQRENVAVRILGEMDKLPLNLQQELNQFETLSQENPSITVSLAINYGGRKDIIDATKKIALAVAEGRIDPDHVSEKLFESYLTTSGIPDPDFVIRTGGEQRMSNFLLWNAAYAELYFSPELWPDFDQKCLERALDEFSLRDRRYGKRKGVNSPHDKTPLKKSFTSS